MDVRQAMKMVHDKSEWWGFVRENTIIVSCHGDMKPLNGEVVRGQAYTLRASRENCSLFYFN